MTIVAAETMGKNTSTVASRRIAETLRTAILEDELTPGTRMLQEEIAARLEVSRIPVREALRMLSAEGLVTVVANSGAWVSRLNQRECSEAYRMREHLEPLLLEMSLPGLEDADIDRIAGLADAMERTDSVDEFMRLDRRFHLAGYAPAPPSYLGDVVLRLWNTTHHYRRAYTQLTDALGLEATHLEHRLLLDGIRRRDHADAARVLITHIRRTRKELERHPEIFA